MLSLLKLPIAIVCNDFIVSGFAASPGAGHCCTSEDSRTITNLFEVVDEPACFVFLIGMIEQEIFNLLKVACLSDVENHILSRPSIVISNAVTIANGYFRLAVIAVSAFGHQFKNLHNIAPFSNGLHPMCFPSLSIVYHEIANRVLIISYIRCIQHRRAKPRHLG